MGLMTSSMNTKDEFVFGLALCVKKLWQENQETRDFTVVVEGRRFSCFRFVLEACSGFFSGLFRSCMKEKEVNSVTIGGMTSATFQLILDVLYTSADVITVKNVFDIWHAANQLQVEFLVKECEKFAISMLSKEHYEDIYQNAKMLSSTKVLEATLDFIIYNFENCKDNETILKLDDFELLAIVDSHELKVSTEDFVIETILKWADYYSDFKDEEHATEAKILADANTSLGSLETSEDKHGELINGNEQKATGESTSCNYGCWQAATGFNDQAHSIKNIFVTNTVAEGNDGQLINDGDQKTIGQYAPTAHLGTGLLETYDKKEDTDDERVDVHVKSVSELRRARLQFLSKLFAASRICLASTHCLTRLQKVKLVVEDSGIRDIVVNAILHQTVGGGHGQIPSTAVHRRCSEYVNVAVYVNSAGVQVLSFLDNKWYTIPKFFDQSQKYYLTYFRDELLAFNVNSQNAISLYVLRATAWKKWGETQQKVNMAGFSFGCSKPTLSMFSVVNPTPFASSVDCKLFIVPHENYIYWLKHSDKKMYRLDLKFSATTLTEVCSVPISNVIEHIATFEDKLLVFCDETSTDSVETVTHCYDVNSRIWTRLNSLEGPAKNLITFRHEEVTYVLQTTGDLWRMVSKGFGLIDFKLVKKLWDFHFDLHGAVTFKDELYLVGDHALVKEKETNWPQHRELYKKIHVFGQKSNSSNFEACVMPVVALLKSPPGTTWVKLDIVVPF
ncbi:unnamed protein product [Lymnaea stagnalis]|uniref:BTB domain-containing protein n=1 Tax=Lymnaea stagnalis TaxID=6523 RepID=A0AAV2HDM8_LYMST